MNRIIINFVVIFIMIYCEGIEGLTNDNYIVLEYYQQPFFFDQGSTSHDCNNPCKDISSETKNFNTDPRLSTTCSGKYNNCESLFNFGDSGMRYCKRPKEGQMLWLNVPSRKIVYGNISDCSNEAPEVMYQTTLLNRVQCPICACTCYTAESDSLNMKGKWWFSLAEQTTDSDKVVTGIRFKEENHVIYLQIKENDLTSDGKGDWKELNIHFEHENEVVIPSKMLLTHRRESILLDEIHVGESDVITGVRFVKVNASGSLPPAIRLEVQKAKLDKNEASFDGDSREWVHGRTSLIKSADWYPEFHDNVKEQDRISFSEGDLSKDFGKSTKPYIFNGNVESRSKKEAPLRGIQLLLVNTPVEYIRPRVIFHENLSPSSGSAEQPDYESNEDLDNSGGTTSLMFLSIVMLPLSIIFNLYN